ncbi:MAG: hypothetical protein WD278_02630 [Pirellulales bacterium]
MARIMGVAVADQQPGFFAAPDGIQDLNPPNALIGRGSPGRRQDRPALCLVDPGRGNQVRNRCANVPLRAWQHFGAGGDTNQLGQAAVALLGGAGLGRQCLNSPHGVRPPHGLGFRFDGLDELLQHPLAIAEQVREALELARLQRVEGPLNVRSLFERRLDGHVHLVPPPEAGKKRQRRRDQCHGDEQRAQAKSGSKVHVGEQPSAFSGWSFVISGVTWETDMEPWRPVADRATLFAVACIRAV